MKLKKWHKVGFVWGATMYIMMIFIFPYFNGEEITWLKSLIGIPFWALGGLAFGYSMRNRYEEKS